MSSMLTISQVAARFGLSRSTLLYYDRIGLLSPSARSRANYRLYTASDMRRMERIRIYRQAGLPLADIARVLDSAQGQLTELLQTRLRELNQEIEDLRRQQRSIVDLLRDKIALGETRGMTKEQWVGILRSVGLGNEEMWKWHIDFERLAPDSHQGFLESIGLEAAEIAEIRKRSHRG